MNKNWKEFQNTIVEIVDRQNNNVPYKAYAQTYARNIMNNIMEGEFYDYTPEEVTRIQLLYIIANMDGANKNDLNEIEILSKEYGIDVKEAINEIIEQN